MATWSNPPEKERRIQSHSFFPQQNFLVVSFHEIHTNPAMEEAIRQADASSYGDNNAADSNQGHVLSSEEQDVLKFEEEYHDKIYNRHISDLVVACVGLFRQMNQKSSSFASGKPETTVECRKDIAEFVAHMNDTFRCWMAETADLAEKFIHDLNSLFNDYKDRKVMVIDVLEMLIEGLQYGTSPSVRY
jgi:hypothetical protein